MIEEAIFQDLKKLVAAVGEEVARLKAREAAFDKKLAVFEATVQPCMNNLQSDTSDILKILKGDTDTGLIGRVGFLERVYRAARWHLAIIYVTILTALATWIVHRWGGV